MIALAPQRYLDLSRYQGAPNFDLIKASDQVQGTIAQAGGYGSLADPQFVRDHSEAKRVGLVAGAYYFADPSQTSPGQQVDHFLSLAPSADFYAADYEIGAGDLTAWADTFQGLLASKTGKFPWAYTGSWFWTAHYHGHNLINYPLWLASYTAVEPAPPPPWTWVTAWQYTSSFACPGIAGGVDASWVYAAPPTPQPQGDQMAYYMTPTTHQLNEPLLWLCGDLQLGPKRPVYNPAEETAYNGPLGANMKDKTVYDVPRFVFDAMPAADADALAPRIDAATQWAINDPANGLVAIKAGLDALKAQVASAPPGSVDLTQVNIKLDRLIAELHAP